MWPEYRVKQKQNLSNNSSVFFKIESQNIIRCKRVKVKGNQHSDDS